MLLEEGLEEKMEAAIDRYYLSVKVDRFDNSRKTHPSQARMALSNVLSSKGMTNDEIAEVIGRHRTTVIHHLKYHDGDLIEWRGYLAKYSRCKKAFESIEKL
jgi:predicted transcriptional regulator